jgi:GrpB-like predicted nucleotidyltransferase (UPF0157 family)
MIFHEPANYQENCVALFDEHKEIVHRLLPGAKIDHIGASVIEGAISKGDLDILVAVDFDVHSSSVETLENAGFTIKKDTLRTAELCMMESSYDGVALQVVAVGSAFEHSFLGFRRALENSIDLRNAYNNLKRSSARLDMDSYRKRKSAFIQNVLLDS